MQGGVEEPQYIPGVCNIGLVEIRRRYLYWYWGIGLSLILILIIENTGADRIWRLLLCVPVGLALTGLLQARDRFCFHYGLRGVFSIRGFRKITRVYDAMSRNQDRATAMRLILQMLGGTVLITLLYYFI